MTDSNTPTDSTVEDSSVASKLHSISRRIVHVKVRNGVPCVGRFRKYAYLDPVTAIHTIMYSFDRENGLLTYGATTYKNNSRLRHEIQTKNDVIMKNGEVKTVLKVHRFKDCWFRKKHVSTATARHDNCPVTVRFPVCLDPTQYLDTDTVEEFIMDHLDEFGRQQSKTTPNIIYQSGETYPYREKIYSMWKQNPLNATYSSETTGSINTETLYNLLAGAAVAGTIIAPFITGAVVLFLVSGMWTISLQNS